MLIEPLGTNFSEILIEITIFSFKKMRLKVSSEKWKPLCLGLNVLTDWPTLLQLVEDSQGQAIIWFNFGLYYGRMYATIHSD